MPFRLLVLVLLALHVQICSGCAWYDVDGQDELLTNLEVCEHLYYDCDAVTSMDSCGLNFMVVTQECLKAIIDAPCDVIGDEGYTPIMDACFPPCSEERVLCDGNLLRICEQMDILREEVHDCVKKCSPGTGVCKWIVRIDRCVCE